MRTIEHVGTVVEVRGAQAVVQIGRGDQCGSGGARCACCSGAASEPRRVRVSRDGLEQGDMVCLSVAAYAGYLSILFVFVLPLVLMVAGGVAAGAVAGSGSELPIIVGGLVGFVLGMSAAVYANSRLSRVGCVQVRKIGSSSP